MFTRSSIVLALGISISGCTATPTTQYVVGENVVTVAGDGNGRADLLVERGDSVLASAFVENATLRVERADGVTLPIELHTSTENALAAITSIAASRDLRPATDMRRALSTSCTYFGGDDGNCAYVVADCGGCHFFNSVCNDGSMESRIECYNIDSL